jgi:hypothetical protein
VTVSDPNCLRSSRLFMNVAGRMPIAIALLTYSLQFVVGVSIRIVRCWSHHNQQHSLLMRRMCKALRSERSCSMSELGYRVGLTMRRSLPILPYEQTSPDPADWAVLCHVWTAPSWQGLFSRLQHWSVQPCVRPFNAVHMTAGHNALRGSGPGQNRAFDNAVAQVGCPDRRIDRLCITCCSTSQPSHHGGCPARSRYRASATGSL